MASNPSECFFTTKRISRTQVDVGEMGPLADKAGLARLVLEEPYRRKAFEDIILNEWDAHPNEKSHRDIAEQFLKTWRKEQERLDLGLEIRKP